MLFPYEICGLSAPTATQSKGDSIFGAVQSFWLKDRLVTIVGIRNDKVKNYEREPNSGYDPITEIYTPATQSVMIAAEGDSEKGVTTKSLGTVFHVTKWLSLFANQSDNFSPSTTRRDINGDLIPVSTGEGRDGGVKFQFFDGKLAGTIGMYKSTKTHEAFSPSSTSTPGLYEITEAIDDIWDIIGESANSPRRKGGGYGGYRHSLSYEASGIELELTYNATRNWRISLTAAHNETVYSNIAPAVDTYLAKYMAEWRTKGAWEIGGNTINDFLDNEIIPNQRIVKSQEGSSSAYIRPWSATFVTRYRFSQPSWLRGFTIGGSVRFRDRAIIGFANNSDGTINRDAAYYGDYIWTTDSFISYERAFFKKRIRWTSRLGVRNIFDNTKPFAVSARPDGVVNRLQVIQPRTFTWSNDFSF